jgi:hypothetical protein
VFVVVWALAPPQSTNSKTRPENPTDKVLRKGIERREVVIDFSNEEVVEMRRVVKAARALTKVKQR